MIKALVVLYVLGSLVACQSPSPSIRPSYDLDQFPLEERREFSPEMVVESMEFWQLQRRGANGNLKTPRSQWFQAAREAGLGIIRFNSSWFNTTNQDFLIGDVNHFTGIDPQDLGVLIQALDEAHRHDLKVVLTMFELPGRRCFNGVAMEDHDYRLWNSEDFQNQAFDFWRELAWAVKDHPAVVAYNILNEPHPELAHGFEEADEGFQRWLESIQGTTEDLNLFNRRMVAAIREVDLHTPIVLEGYFYGSPMGMPYLEPLDDPAVLYSFHNPAPWPYTLESANQGRYSYPERMPSQDLWDAPGIPWTREDLQERLIPVYRFIHENQIPASQIYASEFWCERANGGCGEFFTDLIDIYAEEQWHWSFYAFREDMAWTGLDFEMGYDSLPADYYTRIEEEGYLAVQEELRKPNPIWDALQRGLKGE